MAKNNKNKASRIITRTEKYDNILLLPLMLILAIIPLIVYAKIVPNDEATKLFIGGLDQNIDFFSYYKSFYFVILSGIGLFMFLTQVFLEKNRKLVKDPIYYPMIAYAVLIIVSTIFATHRTVALRGFMDRYEGMWVLLSYLVVMFLGINIVAKEKHIKLLISSLGISTLFMSLIGLTQYIGKDIYQTNFMKKLITPSIFDNSLDSIKFTFGGTNRVYASLYNPNYVGVYATMIFALATTFTILSKDKTLKIISGVISILSLLNLLGSGSRAGLLTLGVYFLLVAIIFRKNLFINWKKSVSVLILLVLVFTAGNIYSEGSMTSRLLDGVKSLFVSNPIDFKDIELNGDVSKVVFDDHTLTTRYLDGGFTFFDEFDNQLVFMQDGPNISFQDPPYNKHKLELIILDSKYNGIRYNIQTNKGIKTFNLLVNENNEFKFLGNNMKLVDLREVESVGFEGREGLASNRGYIWSRSIPMLKDTILIGHGPDTYGLHFPNDDYIGKIIGLNLNQQVDKPHNLYLQIALNTGILSLISFLIIISMYLFQSFKIYIKKTNYNTTFEIAGLGILFLVIIYLVTGLSNDSLISVSPVFWIMLGLGCSINKGLEFKEKI